MPSPRKVIILSDEKLKDQLEKKMKAGITKLTELNKEWSANDCIYQVVQNQRRTASAVDARSMAIQSAVMEGAHHTSLSCRVASAAINHQAKLVMSEPTVCAKSLDSDTFAKQREEYTQQYCDNLYRAFPVKRILSSKVYLDVAVRGIGVLAIEWNPYKGDVKQAPETPDGEIQMTGDHDFRYQNPKYFIMPPNCTIFEVDANWCIGGDETDIEELRWMFPDQIEEIIDMAETHRREGFNMEDETEIKEDPQRPTATILWTYYEKHAPHNGMRGAKVHFFQKPDQGVMILERKELDNKHGELPFCVITDLDLVGDAYGISRMTLAAPHHDRLSKFYSQIEKNIENFGSTRILIPSNMNANVLTANGCVAIPFNALTGEKPIYLQPSAITSDIWRFHEVLGREIDMLYASGEFDRGEINRELSSYAVLTAIERSEAKLVNLFNKKKEFIKRMYTLAISDAQQYITEEREFATAGGLSHHKFQSFKGADLVGRVNLTVDFGMYMPIDPAARKQQLFELVKMGAIEKAGLPMKETVSALMGGDIQQIKDIADMAKDVQKEELYRLMNGEEAPVQLYHEHLSHMSVTATFMNETMFEMLDPQVKQAIYTHFKEHEAKAAEIMAKAAAGAQPPGVMGEGAPPPPNAAAPSQTPPPQAA